MAQQTFKTKALVLKKTKLGESDLILTFLGADGQQIRAVCKGARKPSSSFASRLELYAEAEVLFAHGRNLDIVKEASFVATHSQLRSDFDKSVYAAICAELVGKLSVDGQDNPKMFQMTAAAFDAMCAGTNDQALRICVGQLVKAFAFAGICPQLQSCAGCGSAPSKSKLQLMFSYEDGGYVCDSCQSFTKCAPIASKTLFQLNDALHLPFSKLHDASMSKSDADECLVVLGQWCYFHVGTKLKSLNFLLSNTLD